MVSMNIVIEMCVNAPFYYLYSLAQERYRSVVVWQGFVILFENGRNIGFFPRIRKISLVKGTIEHNRKWIGKNISTFFQKSGTY